jgi:hypothetical protein
MPLEFQYSSAPLPIKPKKAPKYRNEEEGVTLNLMSDPRVVRGSTFANARQLMLNKSSRTQSQTKTQNSFQQSGNHDMSSANEKANPYYEFVFRGSVADEIDLSMNLVEHLPEAGPGKTGETQTDVFIPRAPTPEYIPRKTGIDTSTQVEDVTELFNFDAEVKPLVNVIVGKTLEQSLFELRAEAEMELIHKEIDNFHMQQEEERKWVKKTEAETMQEYMDARRELEVKVQEAKSIKNLKTTVAGLQCMRQIIDSIVDGVEEELMADGTWKDSAKFNIRTQVLDPLVSDAASVHDQYLVADQVLEEICMLAQSKYEQAPVGRPVPEKTTKLEFHKKATKTEESATVLESVDLSPTDSISSLRKMYARIASKAGTAGEDGEAAAEGEAPAFDIGAYLEGVVGRTIAVDAPLINFAEYLPSLIVIEI